jgi:hypothetical protein
MIMRSILFLSLLFSLPAIIYGQQKRVRGKPFDVADLRTRLDETSPTTYRDLLSKFKGGVEIKEGGELGVMYEGNFPRAVIEKARALWFFAADRECLALVVHLRNPFGIRSGYIYSSALLVFHFPKPEGELIQWKLSEPPQAPPPSLDFYDAAPIVVLRNGKIREEAFWLTAKQTKRKEEARKYSLFALENKKLVETLSDVPALRARLDDCGYLSKQELIEISPARGAGAKSDDYPNLKIKILEYARRGAKDCAKELTVPDTVTTYEAFWNGRFYQTKFPPTKIPYAASPVVTGDKP